MAESLVSIIIPLYNREKLISETLDSIMAQSYPHWECIVVDDGSTDDSVGVVSAFAKADSRITIVTRPAHLPKGANTCRNHGFALSKGDYVNWFDSDDLMEKDHLRAKVTTFTNDKELDVCFCESQNFEEKDGVVGKGIINKIRESNLLREFILRKQFIQTGCALWKKTFLTTHFKEEDLFDEALMQSQDYDFYARALYHNPKLIILHTVLFQLRRGNASISSQFESDIHHQSFIQARKKLLKQYQGDREIQNGLINTFLSSYNVALSEKKVPIIRLYKKALVQAKVALPPSKRWRIYFLLILGNGIQLVGKGGYALRKMFKL